METAPTVENLPITAIQGLNSRQVRLYGKMGLHTIGDVFFYAPLRYEDRRNIRKISELRKGEDALVCGTVVECGIQRMRRSGKVCTQVIVNDGSANLYCRWWNQTWPNDLFKPKQDVILFGKVAGMYPVELSSPEFEIFREQNEWHLNTGCIVPVYSLTEGVSQRGVRYLVSRVMKRFLGELPDGPEYDKILKLPTRPEAVRMLHYPKIPGEEELGRKRLAMDELYAQQLDIQRRRQNLMCQAHGIKCPGDNHLVRPFLKNLEFKLTQSQTEVLREMRQDMNSGIPMRRLLQGDVGSGKTVVAACVALMVIEGNYNVVIMAPTEILALQHTRNFQKWFEPLGVPVRLWTGHIKQEAATLPLASGAHMPGIVIGTHALFEDSFQIERLGLVIIDEQHKFGVDQRDRLLKKGEWPHLLVMTATPIPRTLGLTLYGELDISTIKQSPSGRGSVRTFIRKAEKLEAVWEFVRDQIAKGRQAYVVYPLVDESDKPELKAVEAEFTNIVKKIAPAKAGLLHGRMKSDEKDYIMNQFAVNQVQVLVCTTVIEVGMDVPNATVMVIENAERFGLAQLHQLRGRIGRGSEDSYCILMIGIDSPESEDRLHILAETSNGFRIAEEDLRQRGPGDFLGDRQHGMPSFRFANYMTDYALAQRARKMAIQTLGIK